MVSLPRALSKLGLCSRTQAFLHIEAGRVEVNGRVSKDPALRVALERDRICFDGASVAKPHEPIVIALHKPPGYVTTRADPQGRKTVYDLLPKLDRFVFPVGRLDMGTSGLLILTDNHLLGEALTNPESRVPKTYEVVVDRVPREEQLNLLREGVNIGRGEITRPSRVQRLRVAGGGASLRISIDEGKNRQVRRMFSAVGLSVVELCRVGIGDFQLGALPPGGLSLLSTKDAARLLSRPESSA